MVCVDFFGEKYIFSNFVKARLTGLANLKFIFLPISKIFNSHEKVLRKTDQIQTIDSIESIIGRGYFFSGHL